MSFLKDMGGWFKAEKKQPQPEQLKRAMTPAAKPAVRAERQELEELRRQKELADLRAFRDLKVTDTAIKTFCLTFPGTNAEQLSTAFKSMTKPQRDFFVSVLNSGVRRMAELNAQHDQLTRIQPDQLAKAEEAHKALIAELESMNPDNYNFKD